MDAIIVQASAGGGKMSTKEKNILMRLKQIHQDCVREYKQYQVFLVT